MKKATLTFYLLFMAFCNNIFAQEVEKGDYELLILEIEMLSSYSSFSKSTITLIDSAKEYATKSDYEVAIVFLEEAKSDILTFAKKTPSQKQHNNQPS